MGWITPEVVHMYILFIVDKKKPLCVHCHERVLKISCLQRHKGDLGHYNDNKHGLIEIKRNKLTLFNCQDELLNMEPNEIKHMFNRFHTILNELMYLDKHYDNYYHIDKILHSFPSLWRSRVTTFKTSKSINNMSIEENY